MSYISRQALLEKLKYMGDFNIDMDYVTAEDIMSIPSADVRENIHGEWIVREDNTSFVKQIPRRWVECSHCGWSFSYDRIHDDFCSKCGADMRKVVSE